MDVLDAISFLRLAFSRGLTGEDKALVIVIMGFACISLFVPILALFNLVKSNFGAAQISKWVSKWHEIVCSSTHLFRPRMAAKLTEGTYECLVYRQTNRSTLNFFALSRGYLQA